MKDETKTGGPAFPGTEWYDERPRDSHDGMTLRDWFAGQAVAVLPGDTGDPEGIADDAYMIADAMIRRRQVFPKPKAMPGVPDDDDPEGETQP